MVKTMYNRLKECIEEYKKEEVKELEKRFVVKIDIEININNKKEVYFSVKKGKYEIQIITDMDAIIYHDDKILEDINKNLEKKDFKLLALTLLDISTDIAVYEYSDEEEDYEDRIIINENNMFVKNADEKALTLLQERYEYMMK